MVQTDNTDGYYLNICRNNGQVRDINQLASGFLENMIRYPGYLFCQFRLTGTLVEERYGFIFYIKGGCVSHSFWCGSGKPTM